MTVNVYRNPDSSPDFTTSTLVDAAALATDIEEKVAALRVLGFDVVINAPFTVPVGSEPMPVEPVPKPLSAQVGDRWVKSVPVTGYRLPSTGKKPVQPYTGNVGGFE